MNEKKICKSQKKWKKVRMDAEINHRGNEQSNGQNAVNAEEINEIRNEWRNDKVRNERTKYA